MEGHHRLGATLADVRSVALECTAGLEDGPGLTELERDLVGLAVAAEASCLDLPSIRSHGAAALEHGADPSQFVEVLLLASAIGMHALHEGIRELVELTDLDGELDEEAAELRARYEDASSYWTRLDEALPGFLDGLLRTWPSGYAGFFEFCAIPWRSGSLSPLLRELIYVAIDSTPTHRYLPGLRLHLDNAVRLGAGRRRITEVIDIAANAAEHHGVRA